MEKEECLTTKDMNEHGLVDGHAYSLIGAREIKDKDGKVHRICLVRNPWGKKEWTGDWSDSSAKWDEVTKAQVPNFKV